MLTRRHTIAAIAFAALLAADPAAAQGKLKIIASFTILGDLVKNVGGDRVEVGSLIGPNGNAHVFAPSPADAKKIADANVVFVNGLGFEGWLSRLVEASSTKARIVVATTGINPLVRPGDRLDPHAWQSVANVKLYVANIRDALIASDPAGKTAYEANALAYLSKLDTLERDVKDVVAKIPVNLRRVITSHNAFGYFQAAYGIEFSAPQGVSSESEPSAQDVAKIIRQIKERKILGVFLENVTDPRLVQRIAEETGARVGGILYSDALTEAGGPASTYIDLIRHNIRTLGAALIS